jgi:hypothetical protein
MPYCPECLERYHPGTKTCPECEVELMDGAPPREEGDDTPERMVTVANYPFEELAYLGKASLEFEGIWSMVNTGFLYGNNLGLYFGKGGGVGLQVKESVADRAILILEAQAELPPEYDENAKLEDGEVEEELERPEMEQDALKAETKVEINEKVEETRTGVDEPVEEYEPKQAGGEQERCPGCNSLNVHSKFSLFKRKRKCENCGREWTPD